MAFGFQTAGRCANADVTLLWLYPHLALDNGVEIEGDHRGVRVALARDHARIPVAIAVGDDSDDFADALVMWA